VLQPSIRGAVPLDRWLARAATVGTAAAIVALAFLGWKSRNEKDPGSRSTDTNAASRDPSLAAINRR
jgi:hypothetical protein